MSSGGDVVFEFKQIQADVTRVVENVILRVLKGQTFSAGRVSDWTDVVTRRALNELVTLSPNFKFVVTATIGERALTPLTNTRYAPHSTLRARGLACSADVMFQILCYRTEPLITRRQRRTLTKADLPFPIGCRPNIVSIECAFTDTPNHSFALCLFRLHVCLFVPSVSHWDTQSDGAITVNWQNETILCIVLVGGMAI